MMNLTEEDRKRIVERRKTKISEKASSHKDDTFNLDVKDPIFDAMQKEKKEKIRSYDDTDRDIEIKESNDNFQHHVTHMRSDAIKTLPRKINNFAFFSPSKNAARINAISDKPISVATIIMICTVYVIASVLLWFLYHMQLKYLPFMVLPGFLFVPNIVYHHYHKKAELQRFDDTNTYIEQFLIALDATGLVLDTLRRTRLVAPDGFLRECIDDAIQHIEKHPSEKKEALRNIEKYFGCQKTKLAHDTALSIEALGDSAGSGHMLISSLQKDRNAWQIRQKGIQETRHHKFTQVVMSVIMGITICMVFMNCLPDEYSITSMPIVQLSNCVLWFVGMFAISRAERISDVNLLSQARNVSDAAQRKLYYKMINWDWSYKKAFDIKLTLANIPIAILFWFVGRNLFGTDLFGYVGIIVTILFLFERYIDYSASHKSFISQMLVSFPSWSITIALQLQSENVDNAIRNSIKDAPAIMKPELELLSERLRKYPGDARPLIDFFGPFRIKEITSIMGVLASEKSGSGVDINEHIPAIIDQNNSVLATSEIKLAELSMSGLSAMFMTPLLFCGAKLMVDMIAFMTLAFSSMM